MNNGTDGDLLCELVERLVPATARRLVISEGDETLTQALGAGHFPHDPWGDYLFRPVDLTVMAQLETHAARGDAYLIVPAEASWWLEVPAFRGFQRRLQRLGRLVVREEDVGTVYSLDGAAQLETNCAPLSVEEILDEFEDLNDRQATLLDWNTGLNLALRCPERCVFESPSSRSPLPYLDRSVDLVAVRSAAPAVLEEACRVADRMVLVFEAATANAVPPTPRVIDHRADAATACWEAVSIVIPLPGDDQWDDVSLAALRESLPRCFRGDIVLACRSPRQPASKQSPAGAPEVRVITCDDGLTTSELLNHAARSSRGEYVVFYDGKSHLLPGWLPKLIRVLRQDEKAGAAGGVLLDPLGRIEFAGGMLAVNGDTVDLGKGDWGGHFAPYNHVRTVDFCGPGLLATRKECLDRADGFNPSFETWKLAAADYCLRLQVLDRRTIFQPEAVAVRLHAGDSNAAESATCAKDDELFRQRWGSCRSRPASVQPLTPRPTKTAQHRVLVCAPRLPEFDRQSGSQRTFDLLRHLLETGSNVTFVAQDMEGQDRYDRLMRQAGVAVYGSLEDPEELIVNGRFDLAILAFPIAEKWMPDIRRLSPATRVIVDSVDLHFVREARRTFVGTKRTDPPAWLDQEFAQRLLRELNTYAAADAVVTVSQKETDLVNDLLSDAGLAHPVPDQEDPPPSTAGFSQRRGVLFVGNFWRRPNVDAVEFLCRNVLPLVDPALLAEHPVFLVGHGLFERTHNDFHDLAFVRRVGWVPSLLPYLQQARISVAPLLEGPGSKRKLLQSLACGTPAVATRIGVEGLDLEDGEHILLADEPSSFARAIERLLVDGALWQRLAERGREHVHAFHSRDNARRQWEHVIRKVAERSPRPPRVWPSRSAPPFDPSCQISPQGNPREGEAVCQASSAIVPPDLSPAALEKRRPKLAEQLLSTIRSNDPPAWSVLVVGVYLADQPNTAEHIVLTLAASRRATVTQRWVALGAGPNTQVMSAVTKRTVPELTPKFALINELLDEEELEAYDYVLVTDDDVILPDDFLDAFLQVQSELGFALAQPARTHNSYHHFPIVLKQSGTIARQTRFVEPGPLISISRAAFGDLLPFDAVSPTGWGYEYVWPALLARRRLSQGIVDATPIDHSVRKAPSYDRQTVERERDELLARNVHDTQERCFHVVNAFGFEEGRLSSLRTGIGSKYPQISVVIATHNRAEQLMECLASFTRQTIEQSQYELLVVNDGSTDATTDVIREHLTRLPLTSLKMKHSGKSAARNLGLLAARAPLVLFFDDDVADRDLLRQHLRTHELFPYDAMAVLGHTAWAPGIELSPLMECIPGSACGSSKECCQAMFSSAMLTDGQLLTWQNFWEGRLSCKRAFLARFGLHDPRMVNSIDIELGYRLSKHGLTVVFNRHARSYLNRAASFHEYCRQYEANGRDAALFFRLHPTPEVLRYTRVDEASEHWLQVQDLLDDKIRRIRQIEAGGPPLAPALSSELRGLYGFVFDAFRCKGIFDAQVESSTPIQPFTANPA